MTVDMLHRHMLSMRCRYLKKDMADSRMKYQETGDSAIRNQVKRTQNTFLHSVKASLFKGFQREATFYYPNWWGDMPMIVYNFLESYDFSDKTIIPFCTHGGSGLSGTESTIANITGAEMMDGFDIAGEAAQNQRDKAVEAVTEWLREGGFIE